MQAVRDFLSPLDCELIESIPLSTSPQDDYWPWHYEKSGVCSVRSAYRMLVRNRKTLAAWAEGRSGRSNVGAQEKEWTELWSTKVPSKVRVFLWRLARHSIPTGDVRHHRNMPRMHDVVCAEQRFVEARPSGMQSFQVCLGS